MHRWSFHKAARTVSYLPGLFVCAAARIHEQCASCGNMFYPALTCLLDGGARAHRRCTAQQCMLAQQRHFFSATRTCDPLSPRTPSEFSTSLSADLRGVMHPVRMNSATRGRFWLRNAYLSFPTCRANRKLVFHQQPILCSHVGRCRCSPKTYPTLRMPTCSEISPTNFEILRLLPSPPSQQLTLVAQSNQDTQLLTQHIPSSHCRLTTGRHSGSSSSSPRDQLPFTHLFLVAVFRTICFK